MASHDVRPTGLCQGHLMAVGINRAGHADLRYWSASISSTRAAAANRLRRREQADLERLGFARLPSIMTSISR